MLKHLNVHSLRFWTRGRHCLIALPWAKIVDIAMFSLQRALTTTFPVCTCARARCTPPPCVVHHQITLLKLNHCPNFHIARLKFPEFRGLAYCTRVARAHCTTILQVMHHRLSLVERYQCTKFCVASSKFPEGEDACANAQCTCIARALCTQSPNGMHHRITLIELHHCTKFGVDSSKFPKTGGPLSNKLFRT